MTEAITRQQVWLNRIDTTSSGSFIWEIAEVVGKIHPSLVDRYISCRDGSYITIQCYHSFSKETANEFLQNSWRAHQNVINIKAPTLPSINNVYECCDAIDGHPHTFQCALTWWNED